MITRKSLGPHICLRCQRSLAKRSFQLRSAQFLSQRRRYSQEAPKATIDKNEDVDSDDTEGPEYGVLEEEEGNYTTQKAKRKLRGLGKGMLQQEDLEELTGATTLGDKAKIIVLRDSIFSKFYGYEGKKPEVIKPKHIDILGTLAEERGLAGEDEVTRNIDSFRPTDADGVSDWEELDKLTHELQKSFTTSQLERYMKKFKNKRELEKAPETWKANHPQAPISRITPWLPGVSNIEDSFDADPLREYYLTSHTPKQVLALRILRECWRLEIPELVDGIGQFEIQLRKGDLDLLLMGSNSVLNRIHATHLQFDEERLEAYRARNTIRVTTTSAKKYAIVDAFQKAVQGVRREEIPLRALVPGDVKREQVDEFMERYFSDALLADLGQLTNTKVTRTLRSGTRGGRQHLLLVTCIESDPDAISSPIDTVRRLILNYDYSASKIDHTLAIKEKASTSGALIDYSHTQGLNWRQRVQSWTRYTAPISKKVPELDERIIRPTLSPIIEPAIEKPTTQDTQATKISQPRVPDTDDEKIHWSKRYFTNTSALMGNILFSDPQNLPLKPGTTPLNTPGLDQAFSTKVPNLSRVLSKATIKTRRPVERMILNFRPDLLAKGLVSRRPLRSRKEFATSALPDLQMVFAIDRETRDTTLLHVKAIIHEKRTDVMQPDNAVDIRFQQQTTSRLSRRFLKNIRSFLAASQLNLGGGNVDVQPSIILPISHHICQDGRIPKGYSKASLDPDTAADAARKNVPADQNRGEAPTEAAVSTISAVQKDQDVPADEAHGTVPADQAEDLAPSDETIQPPSSNQQPQTPPTNTTSTSTISSSPTSLKDAPADIGKGGTSANEAPPSISAGQAGKEMSAAGTPVDQEKAVPVQEQAQDSIPVEGEATPNISTAQLPNSSVPASSESSTITTSTTAPSPDQNIQYLFTGLEIHSSLTYHWRGSNRANFHVTYTSIEAGKAGGHRSELKIRPFKANRRMATEKEFIGAAYKLADMLGGASDTRASGNDRREGVYADFDGVKVVSKFERKGGVVASRPVKRSQRGQLLFDYFEGRFKVRDHESGTAFNWVESEERLDDGTEGEDGIGGERGYGEDEMMEEDELFDDGLEDVPWHHEK